jgi:hypothetical protein
MYQQSSRLAGPADQNVMPQPQFQMPAKQRPHVMDFDTPEQRIRYMLRNRGQVPAGMPATDMEIEDLFGMPGRPAL